MTGNIIHVPQRKKITSTHNTTEEFKHDVLQGLTQKQKYISSKYFYDAAGSELFAKITRHPDYYLTRCELEILQKHKQDLASLVQDKAINLIELGPGEGIKTNILLEEFSKDFSALTYFPIDISENYLTTIIHDFNFKIPQLEVTAIHSDYFKGLQWLSISSNQRNFLLFLGSSIGNFDKQHTKLFLQQIWQILHHGDYLLIGFDLKKNIDILLRAYQDNNNLTREFNLNLLQRINQELGGHFNVENFEHYATYNVRISAMESYLISLKDQEIKIDALDRSFYFSAFEAIHVEYSHKYSLAEIETFAKTAHFDIIQNFTDSKNYFVDSLWRVNKTRL